MIFEKKTKTSQSYILHEVFLCEFIFYFLQKAGTFFCSSQKNSTCFYILLLDFYNIGFIIRILVYNFAKALQSCIVEVFTVFFSFAGTYKDIGNVIFLDQFLDSLGIRRGINALDLGGFLVRDRQASFLHSHSCTYQPITVGSPVIAETRS